MHVGAISQALGAQLPKADSEFGIEDEAQRDGQQGSPCNDRNAKSAEGCLRLRHAESGHGRAEAEHDEPKTWHASAAERISKQQRGGDEAPPAPVAGPA